MNTQKKWKRLRGFVGIYEYFLISAFSSLQLMLSRGGGFKHHVEMHSDYLRWEDLTGQLDTLKHNTVQSEHPMTEAWYVRLRAFWTRRSFIAVLYAENLMLFRSANRVTMRKQIRVRRCGTKKPSVLTQMLWTLPAFITWAQKPVSYPGCCCSC